MTDPDVLLKMERVEATYNGAIVALHDVSLTVQRGEIVAVLGANGAGKTTTLKAVSNLLPAERGRVTGGTIVFDTVSTPGARPGDLVRRGLVPVLEGRRVFRSLSVEENLITGGIARDSTRAELADDLERIYALFPRLREKRRVLAGLTSGRRAADDGDRPSADGTSEIAGAGRAFDGPRAARGEDHISRAGAA